MARKGIRTPQELKGKKVAMSRFGSVSDIVTRMVLRHWGVEAKDVILMQVGNTPTRIAAILSGQVDGGLINPTDVDRMAASGCCVLLADLSALNIPYARFGVAGLGSYFKANPDTGGRVLQAFTEGIHYHKRTRKTALPRCKREEAIQGSEGNLSKSSGFVSFPAGPRISRVSRGFWTRFPMSGPEKFVRKP